MTQIDLKPALPCTICGLNDDQNTDREIDYICLDCLNSYSATVKHAYGYVRGVLTPIGNVYKHLTNDNLVIIFDFQPFTPKVIIKP